MSRIILSDRGSFLGKSGEQFRVTRKDEPEVLVPARKVEQILVLGSGISVSSDAIEMADELESRIPDLDKIRGDLDHCRERKERDSKQDLIFYERDPGKCHAPGSCRYREHCL